MTSDERTAAAVTNDEFLINSFKFAFEIDESVACGGFNLKDAAACIK